MTVEFYIPFEWLTAVLCVLYFVVGIFTARVCYRNARHDKDAAAVFGFFLWPASLLFWLVTVGQKD